MKDLEKVKRNVHQDDSLKDITTLVKRNKVGTLQNLLLQLTDLHPVSRRKSLKFVGSSPCPHGYELGVVTPELIKIFNAERQSGKVPEVSSNFVFYHKPAYFDENTSY